MPTYKIESNRKLEIASFSIKYSDAFNLDDLYTGLREWLEEYDWKGYDNIAKDEDTDRSETYYSETIGPAGREINILWRLKKQRGFFFRWLFDITQDTQALKKTETVIGGKKIMLDKGTYEIRVKATLEIDSEKGLEKNPLKIIRPLFIKVYKKKIEEEERELYREAYVFQSYIKKWLSLKGVIPFESGKAI